MNIKIVIAPHERAEAVEAYSDWLSNEQKAEIWAAEEGAFIGIQRIDGETFVHVSGEKR